MSNSNRLIHIFPPEVLAKQVGLIRAALDEAGVGAAGLELDQLAGEVIRRDVMAALTAMSIQFDDGCGWRLSSSGGVEITFQAKLERDLPVVMMFVAGWEPS